MGRVAVVDAFTGVWCSRGYGATTKNDKNGHKKYEEYQQIKLIDTIPCAK
jgi:hypothetical protein